MDQLSLQPLVSIIIPVYNAERYLAQSIQSAIDQTWGNKELIIVIDGASDQSLYIANSFAGENIKIIEQENRGASAARNRGIKEAKGAYMQFLDADDILDKDKIKVQIEQLKDKKGWIALGATTFFNDGEQHFKAHITHGWFKGLHQPVQFLTKLYGAEIVGENLGGMIQPNSWLVPAKIIEKAGFWNENLTLDDDGEYFCRVILNSEGIKYVPESINYYRKINQVTTNLSASKSKKAFESAILSTDLKYKHLTPFIEKELLNKIFGRLYWDVAVTLYPLHLSLFKIIRKKIKSLGNTQAENFYTHTPLYRFTTKYFGWKLSAWISFIKQAVFKPS